MKKYFTKITAIVLFFSLISVGTGTVYQIAVASEQCDQYNNPYVDGKSLPAGVSPTVAPGQTVNYSVTVVNNNIGNCQTEFVIRPWFPTGSGLTANPAQMTTQLYSGEQATLYFSVSSPSDATFGTYRFNQGAYAYINNRYYRATKDYFYHVVPGQQVQPVVPAVQQPQPEISTVSGTHANDVSVNYPASASPAIPPKDQVIQVYTDYPLKPIEYNKPVVPQQDTVSNPVQNNSASNKVISIENSVVLQNTKRLGVNIGYAAGFDTAVHFRKNIMPNPGFEEATMRSNYTLLNDYWDGNTAANQVQEFCWNPDWNTENKGQERGTWNEAQYEFITGDLKGTRGTISDFTFAPDRDGNNKYTFTLDKNLSKKPSQYDIITVRKTFDNYDATQKRPDSAGDRSLKLKPSSGTVYYFDDGARDAVEDGYKGKMLVIEGPWELSFWAKGEKPGDKLFIEVQRSTGAQANGKGYVFFNETITFQDTEWHKYTFTADFQGADVRNIPSHIKVQPVTLNISTKNSDYPGKNGNGNTGGVWVDDMYFGETDNINPTVFSDQAVKMLKELNPGILRYWGGQHAEPIENVLGSEFSRGTSRYSTDAKDGSRGIPYYSSLPEVLDLAKEIGADPWYTIPPTLTQDELVQLTQYVMSRAGEFNNIYLEYGNEMWGGGCYGDPFKGITVSYHLQSLADAAFGTIKSVQGYDENKIKLIIGGQASWPGRQELIEKESFNHDITAIAPYYTMAGKSTLTEALGHVYGFPYVNSFSGKPFNQSQKAVTANGKEMAIYEINFHDTGSKPEIGFKNSILTGQAGGITLPLNMLHLMQGNKARIQAAFNFLQFGFLDDGGDITRLWGITRDLDYIQAHRGTGLALIVANKAIQGDMITASVNGTEYWNQEFTEGKGKDAKVVSYDIPYLQTFAFRQGNTYGLIVFNLHQTDAITSKLSVPGQGGNGTKYWLYNPDPLANNERAVNIAVQQAPVTVDNAQQYEFPPHSITSFVWQQQ